MPLKLHISPLEMIRTHPGTAQDIRYYIKRDDLLHPEIQGSKARKLAALFAGIKEKYPGGVLTFGGAFSNHLHAVAVAGRICGIKTTGLLRGEHADLDNPTLRFCRDQGMILARWSKARFDALEQHEPELLNSDFPDTYLLPVGGNTPQAVRACKGISEEILAQLPPDPRPLYLCVPAGTGCTAAGVLSGLEPPDTRLLVFPVSNRDFTPGTILCLLPEDPRHTGILTLIQDYTFGGFAKSNPALLQFVQQFWSETNILPDPVYTAKMMFGIYDLLAKGYFEPGSTVVALHTGGLQGWEGFRTRFKDAEVLFK